jgi:CheY-like chemotaxis protein
MHLTQRELPTLETKTKSILLVDDHRDTLGFMQLFLETKGYRVFTATTAGEALSLLQACQPHVAVLDLGLPGSIPGEALARRLQQRLPEIRLLALSGSIRYEDAERLQSVGFAACLAKPVELEEFLHVVEKYTE